MRDLSELIAVARGQRPADLVLRNGRLVNVFSGAVESGDIAIFDDTLAGIGESYSGAREIDLNAALVAPGLIDAHVHIESSLCTPGEFARAIVPRGVTAVVTDPHEIANVCGPAGVRYIAEASRGLPLDVTLMGPSCVPATGMATAGGTITADFLRKLKQIGTIHGLAEVMNFPGVISGDSAMLEKIDSLRGHAIDGHAPRVNGHSLNAYIAAGVGSDHECISADEAREKLSRGMYVLIREASNARNLDALLPMITPRNSRRICFCTDDRTPSDLLRDGSIDMMVRRAIAFGIDPIEAIRMATLNTAEWFGLKHLGAIAPGKLANLLIFDDLQNPNARMVFARGKLVAENGKALWQPVATNNTAQVSGRCHVLWDKITLRVSASSHRIRVIGSLPDQLVTEQRIADAKVDDGYVQADVSRDLLKMAVVERHHGSGNCGVGFIQGFGFQRGAIAGTVAHDHHNLVCIGAEDRSMLTAMHAVQSMDGGLAVAVGEQIVAQLSLPIAGLMSDRPVEEVANAYDRVVKAAQELGCGYADPFMAMSFMALEVIPSLKLTDKGLVDVEQFKIVDLFV